MLDHTTIQGVFQKHGFVTLLQNVDDTHLAMFHYQNSGLAFYEVIAYREVNEKGETLRREAAFLNKVLPQLQQYLHANPQIICPSLQLQTISFLGKKAHILCNGNGIPLHCCLHPLLVVHTTSADFPETIVGGLPVVFINQLARYLTNNVLFKGLTPPSIHQRLTHYRRAYHFLGGSIIAIPILLGLVGLLASLGWPALSQITLIITGLIPLLLLLTAMIAFNDFKKQSIWSVPISTHITTLESSPQTSLGEPLSHLLPKPEAPENITTGSSTGWTPMATAAFLQDSLESNLNGLIATYQNKNWRAFGEQIRAFLVSGLNLSILKRTGQQPSEDIEILINQVPIPSAQNQLNAWFHRLGETRRGALLTVEEAQQITNFAVHLLRQLHAIPPTWEVQIFRTIPRLSSTHVPSFNATETVSIRAAKREITSEIPTPPSRVGFLQELLTTQEALSKSKKLPLTVKKTMSENEKGLRRNGHS